MAARLLRILTEAGDPHVLAVHRSGRADQEKSEVGTRGTEMPELGNFPSEDTPTALECPEIKKIVA
jgi:hypothetical protein